MDFLIRIVKKILPRSVQNALRVVWHPAFSFLSALLNKFPARSMVVVGINGTKGKSTTAEMLFAILEHAGHKTALASTIRFAIGEDSRPNVFKMTMPGHGYIQNFLTFAKNQGATHAVVELTTEGAREWRHRFLSLDALIMLNVQKEHIERFGSFENYVKAKWWLVRELKRSKKKERAIVVHDEGVNKDFLNAGIENTISFSKNDLSNLAANETQVSFVYKNILFTIPIPGEFNALNALSAIKTAEHLGIALETIQDALAHLPKVLGRLESIDCGQSFRAIVDYAHTPDSLQALYGAFSKQKKICVLGNTGGGRDAWKRPEMGRIADENCETVILTDEDPYEEDPEKIVADMAVGMKRKPVIIMDRREAIDAACRKAESGDVVLISGKGTDPFIMEAQGKKTPWSDAEVVRQVLAQIQEKTV